MQTENKIYFNILQILGTYKILANRNAKKSKNRPNTYFYFRRSN